MTIYKMTLMGGGKDHFLRIFGDEELQRILEAAQQGVKLIAARDGMFNPQCIASIKVDETYMRQMDEEKRYGLRRDWDALPASPFARVLAGTMTMLPAHAYSQAQEAAAREERGMKAK